ncbi:hypothetical protein [Nonomuraea ceibae]|uniref:hypothetical protein n=1 Tax=Nonomuraea ceibae TaxID=1935170 RepID=UPI001C60554F|nr:hypothetical protein [Nonomuraea ceibae]
MPRPRTFAYLAASVALAATTAAAPASAAAHSSASSCYTTTNRTGEYGTVALKCTTRWTFQVGTWCYERNNSDSDRTRIYGGIAKGPTQASMAVCRGNYPYRIGDGYVYDVLSG